MRQSLKRAISGKYFPPNEVTNVVTLDPAVEQDIMGSVKNTEQGSYLTLDPEKTKKLLPVLKMQLRNLKIWARIR